MKNIIAFLKWLILSILSMIGLVTILVLCLGDLAMSDLVALRDICTVKKYEYSILQCDTSANKVEYTFERPIAEVREALDFSRLNVLGMHRQITEEPKQYEYFQKGQSFSYRATGQGLVERKSLIVELDSVSATQTTVMVRTKFSKVEVEKRLGLERIEKRIPSNHVIEYSFLYYLGKRLNIKNMPLIVFPKELSQKQIVETYQSFNSEKVSPFSDVELFGGEIKD